MEIIKDYLKYDQKGVMLYYLDYHTEIVLVKQNFALDKREKICFKCKKIQI